MLHSNEPNADRQYAIKVLNGNNFLQYYQFELNIVDSVLSQQFFWFQSVQELIGLRVVIGKVVFAIFLKRLNRNSQ